jgi:hypothetical protein
MSYSELLTYLGMLDASLTNIIVNQEIEKSSATSEESDKDSTTNSVLDLNHNNLKELQKDIRLRNILL